MEMSTQKIQELLGKLTNETSEEVKAQINKSIDLIKQEMKNYSLDKKPGKLSEGKEQEAPPPPPKKEKIISQTHFNKKYELCLEDIAEELQNYGALISKLKVFSTIKTVRALRL